MLSGDIILKKMDAAVESMAYLYGVKGHYRQNNKWRRYDNS